MNPAPRCKAAPALTYQGKPLCQKCWDRQCAEEPPSEIEETSGDTGRSNEESDSHEKEDAMSTKKSSKKQTKVRNGTTKAKGAKKAGKAKDSPGGVAMRVFRNQAAVNKAQEKAKSKSGRVSAIDAAAQVLKSAGKPMRAQELIETMADKGLWKSPGGKTPHATLYAAMLREITEKGKDARFTKVDRGLFAFNG